MNKQIVQVAPQNLEEELNEAKNSLNLKKVLELNEQIKNQIKTKEQNLETIKEAQPPLTLQEARKNLEYALLKEYLSTKQKEEVEMFLNEQIQLEDTLKERLQKAFLIKN